MKYFAKQISMIYPYRVSNGFSAAGIEFTFGMNEVLFLVELCSQNDDLKAVPGGWEERDGIVLLRPGVPSADRERTSCTLLR